MSYKLWEKSFHVRNTQELKDAGLTDAASIREAALKAEDAEMKLRVVSGIVKMERMYERDELVEYLKEELGLED